ncbi:MAG: methionyl-tRNA formyltransferase [Clostridia bacterium]|nr:methionyl-tRNA formyltransferase [Clostridia bacterium]
MRVMFMGTPDFAIPTLAAIAERHEVCAVVTVPDKPRNRMELMPTPVGKWAAERGFDVLKPQTLKDGAFQAELDRYQPDVIVVVAYGKILPAYVLNYAKHGCLNVHGSLLPEYRGAAPMQRAVMDGKEEIGVTIIQMDSGIDTGDMLLCDEVTLPEDANFEWVHDTLAEMGANALIRTLEQIENGTVIRVKQDESRSTYAQKITKEECALDFSLPMFELHNKIRGLSPVPLSYAFLNGKMIKIIRAQMTKDGSDEPCGTVVSADKVLRVVCGDGKVIEILELLPEGKKRMKAEDFLRGRGAKAGDVFTTQR